MKAFLITQGAEALECIEERYEEPIMPSPTDSSVSVPKLKSLWTAAEKTMYVTNSKVITSIFNRVDEIQLRKIANFSSAKDAWDALQSAHEGSTDIQAMKRRRVESMFDALMMTDDETILDYYNKFKDVTNQAYALWVDY